VEELKIPIRRVRPDIDGDLPLPRAMSAHAAGVDLPAAVDGGITMAPGERRVVPTGFGVAIPVGSEGQVRPRSGLVQKAGITVANAPGTIDSDYRGELRVILVNLGERPATIRRGDRIAQLVVAPVSRPVWIEVAELPPTARGEGGFGHTGD
jgi:dUTP pyrophosphatase